MENKLNLFFTGFVFALSVSLFSCENSPEEKENNTDKKEEIATDIAKTLADLRKCLEGSEKLEDPSSCISVHHDMIRNLNPEQADSIFLIAYQALNRVGGNVDISSNMDLDVEKESKKVEELGLSVDSEEGMPFYCVNWHYLYREFNPVLSKNMQAFIDYRTKHRDKITYDAGLAIDYRELAERIIDAEKVIAKGNFVMREYMIDELSYECFWFMNGLDNTPVFDWETKVLYNENKEEGEFLIENGGPVISGLIKEYHQYLSEHDWKSDESLFEKFRFYEIRKRIEKKYPVSKI